MASALEIPLQQHPSFAAALSRMGRETRAIALEGAAPVQCILRFGLRFASRGPVWDGPPGPARSEALRRAGLHLINSDGGDDAVLRRAGFRRLVAPAQVAELPLTGSREDRLARLRGKWRNALRRAWEAPLRLQYEGFAPRRHDWLLQADMRQQREKGFRSLPHGFLLAFASANPGCVPVFVAYAGSTPVAGMLFLVHGAVATYHMGWSGAEGRRHKAHHALLMRAADKLARQGVTRLDLGGIDPGEAPGLARFKMGTGARIRPLGGSWVRVPGL